MEIKDMKIKEIIEQINNDANQIMLPAIQRKMVWKEEKIIQFIDSILMDYPIGVFLFWSISRKKIDSSNKEYKYIFYKFIQNCTDYEVPENDEMGSLKKSVPYFAVLDGQQRLTSLNIAINGELTSKITINKVKVPVAKRLCINLSKEPKLTENDDEDVSTYFEMKFLSKDEREKEEYRLWRSFNDIVTSIEKEDDIYDFIDSMNIKEKKQERIIQKNLTKIYEAFYEKNIYYYKIPETMEMNDILDIFIRVNSGGEVLQMTDLLFSTIIKKWPDARNEIDDFINIINKVDEGKKFNFNTDFVMRTCFYLIDED